ncbi:hypothetical protein RJ640_012007 [Escallonia rubra]|uniref:Splicing factor 3A subunit 1 n=1 Tax=Escallonia rubra TaxID=112253 RepID=A0AA88U9Y1_9ASTE|nr:hypothetical protein RJ640_012007 [Escallonia rubra]
MVRHNRSEKILVRNHGNAKFDFLKDSDPYHAYYQHRLSEELHMQDHQASALQHPPPQTLESAADSNEASEVLDPPEPELYTVQLPEGITAEELDTIKLKAQCFAMLRPPVGLTDELRKNAADMTSVLERCLHRLEWESSQEQTRQKAEDAIEQNDFSDNEDEKLPPPMALEDVIRRSKMSDTMAEEFVELGNEVDMDMDEEVQLAEEGMRAASLEESGDDENCGDQEMLIRIVKNWKSPEERISAEKTQPSNLKGKTLKATIHPSSETVGSLKEKIAGEIQLPANKQKLTGKGGFLKDNLSLAYYNVSGGETLALLLENVVAEGDK